MFSKIGYTEDHHHSLYREIPLMGTEFDKVYSKYSKITDTLGSLWHLRFYRSCPCRDKIFLLLCPLFGASISL